MKLEFGTFYVVRRVNAAKAHIGWQVVSASRTGGPRYHGGYNAAPGHVEALERCKRRCEEYAASLQTEADANRARQGITL